MATESSLKLSRVLIRGEKRLKLVSDDDDVIRRFQSIEGAEFHEGKRFWHVPDAFDRDELEKVLRGEVRSETLVRKATERRKKKLFWSGKDLNASDDRKEESPTFSSGGLLKRMVQWKVDAFKTMARTAGSLRILVSIVLLVLIGLVFSGYFDFDFLKLFEISARISGLVFVIPVLVVPVLGALAFLFGNKGKTIDWGGFYGISCAVAFIALMITAIGTVGIPSLWKLTGPFICPDGYSVVKGMVNARTFDMPGLVVNVRAVPVCAGELGTFKPNQNAGFVVLTAWIYLSFFIPSMVAAILIKGPMVLRNVGLVIIPLLSAAIYLAPTAAPQQMRAFARPFEKQLNREFYSSKLVWALLSKKPEVARSLLAGGASPDRRSDAGSLPIILAAQRGDYEMVRLLIEKGANPNGKDDMGQLPLIVAARGGYYDMVRLLIEKGADVRKKDKRGNGVLPIIAASRGKQQEKLALIDALLEKGTPVDQTDEHADTALMKVVSDTDLVEHLIEKGADIRHRNVRNENVMIRALYYGTKTPGLLRYYQRKDIDINVRTHYEHTPLTLAVHGYFRPNFGARSNGYLRAEFNPERGQYLGFKFGKGKWFASDENIKKAIDYSNPGHITIDTVRTLLALGADVNAQNVWGNSAVMTTLQYCGNGRSRRSEHFVNACRNLLGLFLRRSGVDYTLKNKEGKTALDYAGWDRDVYGYIKGRSAPAAVTTSEAKRKQGRAGSPDELVRQVVRYGKYRHVDGGATLKHIKTMLENGIDPNRRAKDGSLALVAAASIDMPVIVRELTAHGAGVDRKDAWGNTALLAAVKKGNYDMCELLLAKGADRSVRDRSGKRPVDHAKAMERLDLIELLQ